MSPNKTDIDVMALSIHLTAPLGEFMGERRRGFCTHLVSTVAAIVAEVALAHGADIKVRPFRG